MPVTSTQEILFARFDPELTAVPSASSRNLLPTDSQHMSHVPTCKT